MSVVSSRQAVATLERALEARVFESSQDCVKLLSPDGRLLAMNVNGVCLMEIDDFAALRGQKWATLWPAELRGLVEAAVASAARGSVARFSADSPTARGTPKSWDVTVSPVFDALGAVDQLVSVSQDVTEKRRLESENALLLEELAHRIANVFAVVDGVIALSARDYPEAEPFADALRQRLRDLGRATSYVSPLSSQARGADGPVTLAGLMRVLLDPYGGGSDDEPRRIQVSGDDVAIGARGTTSLALVINELATNALKYGALSDPDGTVDVMLSRTADAIRIAWRERGGPRVEAQATPRGGGFGGKLLENAVVRQLGGSLTRDWSPDGLGLEMSLPLSSLAA